MTVPDHPCSAWCDSGTHVDLVHAGEAWSDADIAAIYRRDYGVAVVRIEAAREAPDRAEPSDPARRRPGRLVWWQ